MCRRTHEGRNRFSSGREDASGTRVVSDCGRDCYKLDINQSSRPHRLTRNKSLTILAFHFRPGHWGIGELEQESTGGMRPRLKPTVDLKIGARRGSKLVYILAPMRGNECAAKS